MPLGLGLALSGGGVHVPGPAEQIGVQRADQKDSDQKGDRLAEWAQGPPTEQLKARAKLGDLEEGRTRGNLGIVDKFCF